MSKLLLNEASFSSITDVIAEFHFIKRLEIVSFYSIDN
jgi:hypothetical protein